MKTTATDLLSDPTVLQFAAGWDNRLNQLVPETEPTITETLDPGAEAMAAPGCFWVRALQGSE